MPNNGKMIMYINNIAIRWQIYRGNNLCQLREIGVKIRGNNLLQLREIWRKLIKKFTPIPQDWDKTKREIIYSNSARLE